MRTILSTLVTLAVMVGVAMAAVATKQVTVTNSATSLCAAAVAHPETCLVINQGSVSVFLGPSTVTTSTGVELKPAASASIALQPNDNVYGITASSTARVDVLEK